MECIVWFLVELIINFMVTVWAQTMSEDQEGQNINRSQKCEACDMLLKKIVVQHVKNFLEPREFQQLQYSVFWLMN